MILSHKPQLQTQAKHRLPKHNTQKLQTWLFCRKRCLVLATQKAQNQSYSAAFEALQGKASHALAAPQSPCLCPNPLISVGLGAHSPAGGCLVLLQVPQTGERINNTAQLLPHTLPSFQAWEGRLWGSEHLSNKAENQQLFCFHPFCVSISSPEGSFLVIALDLLGNSAQGLALSKATAPCVNVWSAYTRVHLCICTGGRAKPTAFFCPQKSSTFFLLSCLYCFPEEKKPHWTFLAESCHLQWKADYTMEVNNKSMILSVCLG